MKTRLITTAFTLVVAISATAGDKETLSGNADAKTMGYGTSGIAEEVTDPDLGSVSSFGGDVPADYRPGDAKVSDSDPTGIGSEPGDEKTMGYGTSGIAEEVTEADLGSASSFGGEIPADYRPGEAKVSDENPRGIDEGPGDDKLMGYGTKSVVE